MAPKKKVQEPKYCLRCGALVVSEDHRAKYCTRDCWIQHRRENILRGGVGLIKCRKCGIEKPHSEMQKKSAVIIGVSTLCKSCLVKESKDYYATNGERYRATNALWVKNNKARVAAYLSVWQKAHPEIGRMATQRRRARILESGGTLSKNIIQVLWKRQKGKCATCKADLRKTGYHLDHIIPLAPKNDGPKGRHEDRNVQLTCPTCNFKKGNKDPIQFMQEMGYLL